MRRSLRCLPLLAMAIVTTVGCAHRTQEAAHGFDPPRAAQPAQTTFVPPGIGSLEEAAQRNAQIFAATYGMYRCADGSPPGLLRTAFRQPRSGQILGSVDGCRISLQPGPERQTDDGRRTASRYRLRNAAGKTLAESESLLSEDILKRDDLAGENRTDLFTDPAGSAFLIVEFRSGTGPRYHLFVRSGDAWQARMVHVPVREEPSYSPMHFTEPQVIGVSGGRVFCETDGAVYAFPFSELAELTDPAFGIG
jgi:hypothetical protein